METVSSRTQLASAHWHLVSTWKSGSFPFGRNFYSIPPSEAKLLAQWGPQFTKVPLNAWALFTDGWANEKPDGIQPLLAAMKKQNRCRCVERVELGAGGGALPHHRHFSRLLSCHSIWSATSLWLSKVVFAIVSAFQTIHSLSAVTPFIAKATQQPLKCYRIWWNSKIDSKRFDSISLTSSRSLHLSNKAVWSLNVTFSRKESYLLSYFLGNG